MGLEGGSKKLGVSSGSEKTDALALVFFFYLAGGGLVFPYLGERRLKEDSYAVYRWKKLDLTRNRKR